MRWYRDIRISYSVPIRTTILSVLRWISPSTLMDLNELIKPIIVSAIEIRLLLLAGLHLRGASNARNPQHWLSLVRYQEYSLEAL